MLTDTSRQLQPPSQGHLLGTDLLGRDVLSRMLYGGRNTLSVALLATVLSLVCGTALGLVAAVYTRLIGTALTTLNDALLALPGLALAFIIITLLGRSSLTVALAISLSQLAPTVRIVRSVALTINHEPYVLASYAIGATRRHVLIWHILRNMMPTLSAYSVVVFSYSIINAAALGLLGLGFAPGSPEWGLLLAEGRQTFRVAPWVAIAPGLAISMTVLALNTLSADDERLM